MRVGSFKSCGSRAHSSAITCFPKTLVIPPVHLLHPKAMRESPGLGISSLSDRYVNGCIRTFRYYPRPRSRDLQP